MTARPRIGHSRPRIGGLDVARALALFGIMGNHLMGSDTTASWFIVRIMADFHAVAFAVLIGAGAQLEYEAAKRRNDTSWLPVLIRAGFLIVLGLAVGWWATRIAVILVTLGLLTLVCRAIVPARTSIVAAILASFVIVGPLLTAANVAYDWGRPLYSPDFFDVVRPAAYISLMVADPYPFVAWVTYGVVGIMYVRLVVNAQRRYLAVAGGAIIGAAIALGVDLLTRDLATLFTDRLLTWEAYSGSYVNIISSALIVVAGVALCSWAVENARGIAGKALTVLAGVGQLTLTWYVVHIFASDRMIGFLENLEPHLAYLDIGVWAIQIALVCLLSPLYLANFRIGPLEAVPRWISQRIVPTRRDSHTGSGRGVPPGAPSRG